MNILIWNCRGVGNKDFGHLLNDLSKRYKTKFLVLSKTHISGNKAQKIIRTFNFEGYHIVNSDGFSGGIWCFWKQSKWQVNIFKEHKHYIHMNVCWNNKSSWLFTAIYSSLHSKFRKELWEGLYDIAVSIHNAWCVGGL